MATVNRISAGEAFLRLRVDDDGFDREVTQAVRQMRVLEEANRRINAENRRAAAAAAAGTAGARGGALGALAGVGGSALAGTGTLLTNIASGLRRILTLPVTGAAALIGLLRNLSNLAIRAGSAITRLGESLQRTATLGFGSFRAFLVAIGTSAAVSWPVKMAADIELATVEMAVFVGSLGTARQLLIDLQKFAPTSLLSADELAKGAALLLRYSVSADVAQNSVKALAAISAGSAEEFQKLSLAFAQVASEGLLRGEEVRQFKNTAFNPLREIAARTGETIGQVRDRMQNAKVTFEEVTDALAFATGPLGRFAGLLDAISSTLTGAVRRAFAQFRLALLPLGEELLPALKGIVGAINDMLPTFARWVTVNSRIVTTIAGLTLGFTGLLGTVFAVGTAFRVIGFVLAGLGVAMSLLINPVTVIGALVVGLAVKFGRLPAVVGPVLQFIAEKFSLLVGVADKTFVGIADALSAGQIKLAADILWTGLRLAWLEGTRELADIWLNFKDVFLRTMNELKAGVLSKWKELVNGIKIGIVSVTNAPALAAAEAKVKLAELSKSPALFQSATLERSKLRDATAERIAAIQAETEAELAGIENRRQARDDELSARTNAERDARAEAIKDARNDLIRLRNQARSARRAIPKPDFGQGFAGGAPGAGAGGVAAAIGARSTFGGRLAEQVFGVASSSSTTGLLERANRRLERMLKAEEQSRDTLREIDRNTRRANQFSVGNA